MPGVTTPNQAQPVAQPSPPPIPAGTRRRRSRPLVIVVVAVVALAVIVVVGNAVQRHLDPPGALPDLDTFTFTVGPHPTKQQVRDAADVLEADVTHLGGSGVRSAIRGDTIEVGVPEGQIEALVPVQGRRLRPVITLRLMNGTDHNSDVPAIGQECAGEYGPIFCDADRTGIGTPGTTYLTGTDVADATAAADPQTGTWSVTVTFTGQGKQRYAQAIQAQGPYGLLAYAVQLDTQAWALAPLSLPYAVKADGRIPNLTQDQARRIAAVLRLCRTPVEITS
jgi:preprotein translocase subunit SecD